MIRLLVFALTACALTACGSGNNSVSAPAARSNAEPTTNEAPEVKRDPARAQRLIDDASELYLKGDNSAAAELLERAVPLDPENSELLAFLARTYEKLRRYDEARELYLRAARLVDGKALFNMQTGAAHCSELIAHDDYTNERYDDAWTHIQRAIETRPDSRDTQMLRGYIQMQRHEYADAAEAFQAALGLSVGAQRHDALSWLGQAQYAGRDYESAAATYTKLIEEGVEGREAYGWRAYCNLALQDRVASQRDFQQALQRTQDDAKKQEYRDALRALEEAK
ncbi:MAG: tetratricopeptide repeat protein [Planctomycetota bacterium]